MSEKVNTKTILEEKLAFEPSGLSTQEAHWLSEERKAAWELYLRTPQPTARHEDWRLTEIDSLDLQALSLLPFKHNVAGLNSDNQLSLEHLPSWLKDGLTHFEKTSATIAITENGVWSTPLAKELSEQGVIFCDLLTAIREHPKLVQAYLATDYPGFNDRLDSKFGLLNKSLFNIGIFLYVPTGVSIEAPFLSLIHFDNKPNITVLPRVLAVLEANSGAKLVQVFTSHASLQGHTNNSLASGLIELHVKENAQLDYVEIQNFDEHTFAISEAYNLVAQDGQLSSLTIALGGAQLKGDINTILCARGAHSDVQGIVLGDHREHFSFNTIQEHLAPDTKSNINFRIALKGESASIYQGIIHVDRIAQRTDAFQSNKNLILGGNAKADSIPKLEILADDVKCSHGATVGPVDREQVFYLMSRGLSAKEAEELIVSGFFRQVLESCRIEGIKAWVGSLVANKIATGYAFK